MPDRARNPVTTSRKTIRILEKLYDLEGARVTELADALGMNKSTVHNHLSTLEAEEIVIRDGNEYDIGLRLLEFGGYARDNHLLSRVGASEIERLANRTGELVNVVVEEFGKGVYIACEKGDRAVELNQYPGYRRPLHVTASGKAILAHMPDDRIDEIVDRHGIEPATENSITDRSELEDELRRVDERGFALDDEESVPGLRCVGASILDSSGAVIGAISVSAPTSRITEAQFRDEIPDAVRSTANVIELNINY
ncbi:IclR family transcriptional regulator [Natrarchaeobius chitinivorans]|uniref:IclR family transcriptional regulator n=1 Tax=Natrarchaeobius chitinivorans TaxID=1679083 RepID=A0A3N6N5Q6_NATCH|nr:IclR family transcriptional regulator [Natrarchaeobius chitinivorans]RQG93632.1 IclR family transcriptional regulator [Natrarchaeobius chitinivorans]